MKKEKNKYRERGENEKKIRKETIKMGKRN